jgi:hypothetical protein
VWAEDPNGNTELFVDDSDRFGQIRVVRYDYELTAITTESVDQHIYGEIYIRALLFHLQDIGVSRSTGKRRGEPHSCGALQVVPKVHCQLGYRSECTNINVLPSSCLRIGWHRLHKRCEVANAMNPDIGSKFAQSVAMFTHL